MSVYVKKQGRVCTVFIDPHTNVPLPIAHFEDAPMDGFPFTSNEEDIRKRFGNDLVFIEKQHPPQPVVKELSDAEYDARIREITSAHAAPDAPPPQATAPAPSGYVGSMGVDASRVQQVLATHFARYAEATGKRKAQLKLELEAICNFILQVSPQSAPMLQELRNSLAAPKFEL